VGEGGFAKAGRPVEEQVVERLAAGFRRVHRDAKVVLELFLADELVQTAGTEGGVQRLVVVERFAGDDALSSRRCGPLSNTCAIRTLYGKA
jgi:hypothetical protein